MSHVQRVVCAAIRNKRTGVIICGARHFDKIMQQLITDGDWVDADQGFIDQKGEFLDRKQAYHVAMKQCQTLFQPTVKGLLFSEDLY